MAYYLVKIFLGQGQQSVTGLLCSSHVAKIIGTKILPLRHWLRRKFPIRQSQPVNRAFYNCKIPNNYSSGFERIWSRHFMQINFSYHDPVDNSNCWKSGNTHWIYRMGWPALFFSTFRHRKLRVANFKGYIEKRLKLIQINLFGRINTNPAWKI